MDYDPQKHADMRPGFGPVLGPPKPRHLMSQVELLEDNECLERLVEKGCRLVWAESRQREATARAGNRRILGWIIAAFGALLLFCAATLARADEPYVEAWAIRGQALTRNFPEVTERLFEMRGYWGGEVIGRLPVGKLALIGRFSTEGAAGGHSFRDPGTWQRIVAEAALSYRVLDFAATDAARYSCSVFAGYGISDDLTRGRNFGHISDEANELAGPPPRYGVGLHCRDEKLKMWLQPRVEWDDTVGPGPHPAVAVHLPLFGERTAVGIDAVWGDYAKVQVQLKARLWQWSAK
jgi:hypothetical protein